MLLSSPRRCASHHHEGCRAIVHVVTTHKSQCQHLPGSKLSVSSLPQLISLHPLILFFFFYRDLCLCRAQGEAGLRGAWLMAFKTRKDLLLWSRTVWGREELGRTGWFLPTLAPLAFTMVNTDLIGQARAEGGDPVESVRRGGGG